MFTQTEPSPARALQNLRRATPALLSALVLAAGLLAIPAAQALAAETLPDGTPTEEEFAAIGNHMVGCDSDGDGRLHAGEYDDCPAKPAPFDNLSFGVIDPDEDGFASMDNIHGYLTENFKYPD